MFSIALQTLHIDLVQVLQRRRIVDPWLRLMLLNEISWQWSLAVILIQCTLALANASYPLFIQSVGNKLLLLLKLKSLLSLTGCLGVGSDS